jgi:hypothetical protein
MPEATSKLADALPADALKDAGQRLLGLLVQRAADAATERVTSLTDRLTDVSDNGGQGLRAALGGRSQDERDEDDEDGDRAEGDEDGDRDGGGGGFLSGLKEKVKGVFGGGGDDGDGPGGGRGSSGKRLKVTHIVEHLDIGLPLRTTYDLWTRFGDFPTFMKKVETVDTMSDEKTQWQAKIFISRRQWEATILEQVPDSHIVWRSKGAKGHVDGAVSFTPLEPNATRVLLVLEYWPKGLFEYTGNLWRAQGRRARLEFKHFRRHAMTTVLLHPEEVEGWRGEIHDGEVVKTHEEALEEEQRAGEEGEEESFDETGDESRDMEAVDEDETAGEERPEDEDLEDVDDEYDLEDVSGDEDEADEDLPEYESDEAVDEADEEPADEEAADDELADEGEPAEEEPAEEDEAPAPARRGRGRRVPAGAGGRRGR